MNDRELDYLALFDHLRGQNLTENQLVAIFLKIQVSTPNVNLCYHDWQK